MMYEAADWQSPITMARALLRRHRDLSTVRAMVHNEFGRCPDIEDLRAMQKRIDAAEFYLSHRFASIEFDKNAVKATDDHRVEMTKASQSFARKLRAAL